MKRINYAAGNWKMNTSKAVAAELSTAIAALSVEEGVMVVLAPPHVYLSEVIEHVANNTRVTVAAQNCHDQQSGAYTGEVSAAMLADIGCDYVILGHSERRQYQDEGDALLARKTDIVLRQGLRPIFCVGEPLEVRKSGKQESHVTAQVRAGLFHLSAEQMQQVVIAYEPIWAIGTGETATPSQAQDMHHAIRSAIVDHYGASVAQGISILYGGSVKPANAVEIFSQPDVDGGLVGGASLDADSFAAIIAAF